MRIRVTEDHIAKGKQQRCRECPVALAIREAAPTLPEFLVWTEHVSVIGTNHETVLELDDDTVSHINQFDVEGIMTPFEFDLPLERFLGAQSAPSENNQIGETNECK